MLAIHTAAPVVIGAIHLVVAYTIVSLHCQRGVLAGRWFGANAVDLVLGAVTLVAFLAAIATTRVAARAWRDLRSDNDEDPDPGDSRRVLLVSALALDALVIVYLLGTGAFIAVITPC